MQPNGKIDPIFVQEQLRKMADALQEAMQREVEKLRKAGLPIYVSENGEVVDLQQHESDEDQPAS